MNNPGDNLPTGFQGPVKAWSSLLPGAERVLCLPQQRGVREQGFDLIEVRALTESLGRVEDAMVSLADQLADGGTLLLDVDNQQSMRMLRLVLEGRPGQFDPAGSPDDPSQALPLRRVIAACAAARLHVSDIIAVPEAAPEIASEFARDLFGRGLMPVDWLAGPPPSRFWLVCHKVPTVAGAVLIAGGDEAARQRTERCVREFLPGDWEVVTSSAPRECAQWNRAVSAARGEVVWFLRGGTLPTAEQFLALMVRSGIGPVAFGGDGEPGNPGDICGMMLPRVDALLVGPVPENVANTAVALEEHTLRFGVRLLATHVVEGSLPCPPAEVEQPETFACEAEAMMARWQPLQPDTAVDSAATDRVAADSATDSATDSSAPPWSERKPRISLCMIARNEEHFLPECLTRARESVDEIILVDTGSTDRTVEIAESFGARVLHEPWQDDFSAPRNSAIKAATGDWILVLDADEFLQVDAAARIRELAEDPKVSGYHLHFVNVYSSGKTLGVMMVRLFRNLPGVEYENVIHEQVSPSLQREGGRLGLVLSQADVEVEHHGYSDEVMDARGKNERNERLFKKQILATPDDIYAHYKYGDFLRRVPGRGDDARQLLERCLELILAGPPGLPRELPYAGEVAALCALETARLGNVERAREILDVALRRFVPTPNLFYLSASLALSEGRAADAITQYRRCLAYSDQVLVVPVQEGITSYVSLAGIAQCWMLRGDLDRARQLLEQAIAIEPSYEVAHLALSRLWLQQNNPQRALRVLTEFLAAHPDSPGACQQTTLILHRCGQTAQARQLGQHAVQLLEARALDREAAEMNSFLAAI